jgi:hypothetical protein
MKIKILLAFIVGMTLGLACNYREEILDQFDCHPCQFQEFLPQQAPAVEGILILDAPESCEVGELVRLDTAGSTVSTYKWAIVPTSEDFMVVENGQRAVFSGREPGHYIIVVAAATGDRAALVVHELEVLAQGGSAEHIVARWLKKVKYDDPFAKAKMVAKLSATFGSLALDNIPPTEMLQKAAAANRAVLGDDLEKWEDFLIALGHYLDQKSEAGQLTTTEEYQAVWQEISDALRV